MKNDSVKTFLLIMSIVLLIELTINALDFSVGKEKNLYSPMKIPSLSETRIEAGFKAIENIPDQQMIFLGDSSCFRGLSPGLIKNTLGIEAWNLALFGYCGMESYFLMLKEYLLNHSSPRWVVLHIGVRTLTHSESVIRDFGWRDRFVSLIKRNREKGSRFFPSWEVREIFQQKITQAFGFHPWDRPRGKFPSHNEFLDDLLEKRGWMPTEQSGSWKSPPLVRANVSRRSKEMLKRMTDVCHRNGTELIIMINPLPRIADIEANRDIFNQIASDIKTLSKHFGCLYLEPVIRFFPNEEAYEIMHINQMGAVRNTMELISWIKNYETVSTCDRPESDRIPLLKKGRG